MPDFKSLMEYASKKEIQNKDRVAGLLFLEVAAGVAPNGGTAGFFILVFKLSDYIF